MAGLDSVALARKMAATAPDIMRMSKVVIPGAGKKAASGNVYSVSQRAKSSLILGGVQPIFNY